MNPKMKNAWDYIPISLNTIIYSSRHMNHPPFIASKVVIQWPKSPQDDNTCTQNSVMTGPTAAPTTGGGSGRKVLHDYHDHGHIAYNSEVEKNLHVESRNNNHRGKVPSSFPEKLHLMLSEVEGSGLTDIVSW
jgi:hypothetical protein